MMRVGDTTRLFYMYMKKYRRDLFIYFWLINFEIFFIELFMICM